MPDASSPRTEFGIQRLEIEGVASLACDLLNALQPWGLQPPEVRSAATRLTVALAALPLPQTPNERSVNV